ncbi:kinase domain-containing protein [Pochonia chlamydosporia 170]|uniref:Kinase domain-containing protein n=1 Tax=Pochonia chlamydosporia 170 TaxID=1380566 RepID=A0A179F8I2_METCM|nr:kinase domain-containing protein [Pochonia chlamydosporia 170]OAQ61687.1 kinase domain-containing protein [Pochonia chlamydosporia 170]
MVEIAQNQEDKDCHSPVARYISLPTAPNSQVDESLVSDDCDNVMTLEQVHCFLDIAKESSILDSVHLKLKNSRLPSEMADHQSRGYLPIEVCLGILTRDIIKALIKETHSGVPVEEFKKLLNAAIESPRLLAILILMESISLLSVVEKAKIFDRHLPLIEAPNGVNSGLRTSISGDKVTHLLSNWTDNMLCVFDAHQNTVCVPFFNFELVEDKIPYFTLVSGTHLPWKSCGVMATGGSGIIRQVSIHPGHHNFKSEKSSEQEEHYFALKEIGTLCKDSYLQELRALRKTHATDAIKMHLIKLLLAFEHGTRKFLMFEWADGNLYDYWKGNAAPPEPTIEKCRWAAKQCLGLAAALGKIHGHDNLGDPSYSSDTPEKKDAEGDEKDWGRHGDIKPQNILWFKSYANEKDFLVISDLGLTRFHSQGSRSKVSPSGLEGHTAAYCPPEMVVSKHISQRYDIWSLGCVFLEFCTWWARGYQEGILRFESDRGDWVPGFIKNNNFFIVSKSEESYIPAQINPAVSQQIKDLLESHGDDRFAGPMLKLVKNKMLVVDKTKRAGIVEVHEELSEMVKKLEISKG